MPAILARSIHAIGSPEYNAENRAESILTFLGIVGGLALLVVCLRVYVRRFMLGFLGADDYAIIMATLCGIGLYVCFCGEIEHGLGKHATTITPEHFQGFLHWFFYHNILVLVGICFAKVSICLLLIRLSRHQGYSWFLWSLLVFLVAYHVACVCTIIFWCIPVSAQWDLVAMQTAKCMSPNIVTALGLVNTSVNIFTDVLLAVLPIPVIMAMQLNKRTKFALSVVLFLGFIAAAAGAVKLRYQITFLQDEDRLFRGRFPVWAAVEVYLGILACSLPILKPLIAKALSLSSRSSGHEVTGPLPSRQLPRLNIDIEDHPALDKSSTFISQCTTVLATPSSQARKDSTSYFSFRTKKPSLASSCLSVSQPPSLAHRPSFNHLDPLRSSPPSTAAPPIPPRDREMHPVAVLPRDRSASVSHDASMSYIVRTRNVTTTTELAELPDNKAGVRRLDAEAAPRLGKRRSQSVNLARTEDEWAAVKPLKIRKGSGASARGDEVEEGFALRRAMEIEEGLPGEMGDADSVRKLVPARVGSA